MKKKLLKLGSSEYFSSKLYIVDGAAGFRPAPTTISGSASYPDDDYEVTGSGTSGTKTFTRTGGDPLSDLTASTAVQVVMEDASGNLEMNVAISVSGSDVTLVYPLGITATKLHQGFRETNSQHLSPKGAACLAQYIYNTTRKQAFKENVPYMLYHDDIFSTSPETDKSSPMVWRGIGLNNQDFRVGYTVRANILDASSKLVFAQSTETVRIVANEIGDGAEIVFPTNGVHGFLEMTIGSVTSTGAFDLELYLDDTLTQTVSYTRELNKFTYEIPSTVAEVNIKILRTSVVSGDSNINIGAVQFSDLTALERPDDTLINDSDRVLFIGDSWFDQGNVNGLPFDTEWRTLHSGFTSNRAIGGSKIQDWIDDLQSWLESDSPTHVIFHTGINEYNANDSAQDFWNRYQAVISTVKAFGADIICVTQGATASQTQAQGLLELFNSYARNNGAGATYGVRLPSLSSEFLDQASSNEFTNSSSVINNRNKVPTSRVVERLTDSENLTPAGTSPSDTWTAV